MGLVMSAEYIVITESSGATDHADRAIFARQLGAGSGYWATAFAPLVCGDQSTINGSSTDQNIMDRIWTLFPVMSYLAVSIPYRVGV